MFTWFSLAYSGLPQWLVVVISAISLITFVPCAAFAFGKIVKQFSQTQTTLVLALSVFAWLIAFGFALAYGVFGLMACGVACVVGLVLEGFLRTMWIVFVVRPFGIGKK